MAVHRRLEQLQNDLHRLVLEKHHQSNMSSCHMAIEKWLDALEMLEYKDHFSKYNGVEDLLQMSEAEIHGMGVKNAAHRAKIVSSLRILRDKLEKMTPGKRNPPLQQATAQLNWSPPSFINSPEYQQVGQLSPEKLQHELLVELQGDPSDLKSKPWYHGNISRQRAETALSKNGDFLVRDCISQPGDFVLSCFWKGGPLHFIINSRVVDQGPYKLPKVKYFFEDLIPFDSVQDLIQDYMNECRPITDISGAVITTPIARCMPLSFYDSKYGNIQMAHLLNQQTAHYSNVKIMNSTANMQQMYGKGTGVSPKGSPRSSPHGTPGVSPHGTPRVSPHGTPGASPHGSPHTGRKTRFVERSGSQPLLSVNDIPVYLPNSMDRADSLPFIPGNYTQAPPIREVPDHIPPVSDSIYKQVTPTEPQTSHTHTVSRPPHPHFHQRSGSAPVLTPGINITQHFDYLAPPIMVTPAISDSDLHKPPPPKPSRIPSVKYKAKPVVQIRNQALYEDDYRDYSDYSQVTSEPSWIHSQEKDPAEKLYDNNFHGNSQSNFLTPTRDVNQNLQKSDSRKVSDTNFNILDGVDSNTPAFPLELKVKGTQIITKRPQDDNNKPKVKLPNMKPESCINLNKFSSELLPNENRVLEPSGLLKVKEFLKGMKAKALAQYLTKADVDMLKVLNEEDLGVKVTSGLELITLPQGKQLRQDLLERIYCLQSFLKITIITCPEIVDRAAILSQWIQVAIETWGTVGNWFAFENIMEGLMSQEIQKLQDTWTTLRQIHTTSAVLFDTKLKTAFRNLHDGSGSLPLQGVCIPSINPIVQLLERAIDDNTYLPWESADINNGLDTMLIHLDTGRLIISNCDEYRTAGKSIVGSLEFEKEKLEMFQTPFHMRILWGKGAQVDRTERHNKFTLLLKAYSDKVRKEEIDGTAV